MPIAMKAHLNQPCLYHTYYVEFASHSTVAYVAESIEQAKQRAREEFGKDVVIVSVR